MSECCLLFHKRTLSLLCTYSSTEVFSCPVFTSQNLITTLSAQRVQKPDLGPIDETLESTSATKTSLAAVEARVTATEKKANAAGTKTSVDSLAERVGVNEDNLADKATTSALSAVKTTAVDALAARVTALEKPAEA